MRLLCTLTIWADFEFTHILDIDGFKAWLTNTKMQDIGYIHEPDDDLSIFVLESFTIGNNDYTVCSQMNSVLEISQTEVQSLEILFH